MGLNEDIADTQRRADQFVKDMTTLRDQWIERIKLYEEIEDEAIERCIANDGHVWPKVRPPIGERSVCERCGFKGATNLPIVNECNEA